MLALLNDFRTFDWASEYKYPTVVLDQIVVGFALLLGWRTMPPHQCIGVGVNAKGKSFAPIATLTSGKTKFENVGRFA